MDGVIVFIFYVCISGLIGAAVASAKGASRYQGFLWGFVLGPIGWIIAALVLKDLKKEARERDMKMQRARDLAREQSAPKPKASVADELTKLAALKQSGALTEDEFAAQKKRLLA